MCATLFGDGLYEGWSLEVIETDSTDLSTIYDNDASSIKVIPGCIFKGYKEKSKVDLLKEITEDIPRFGPLNINDQLSSYSCSCEAGDSKGMYRSLNSNRIFIHTIRHHRISKGV